MRSQVGHDAVPIRILNRSEQQMLPAKAIRAVRGAIINETVAVIQVLVMRREKSLVRYGAKRPSDPHRCVRPCGGSLPPGRR